MSKSKMALNPLDEVLNLLSADLEVIKEDEPLDQVIGTLENLGDTFKFLQRGLQTTDSLAKTAFEDLKSSPQDFQKGLDNLYNEIRFDGYTKDLEDFSDEIEDGEGILADTARFFGDTFRSIAGLEEDTLSYLDFVIMVISLLVFILIIFTILVLVALCRRKIRARSSWSLSVARDLLKDPDTRSQDSGDCSVSWISINTDTTGTSASDLCYDLPTLENFESGKKMKTLRGWTVAEISPSVIV